MGTLKITESGHHTWTKNVSWLNAMRRLSKLGQVYTPKTGIIRVKRWDGSVIQAKFFGEK